MDTGCSSPRQQQHHHHHRHPSPAAAVIILDRSPARGASSGTPGKLTPSQEQAVAVLGVQNQTSNSASLYIVCSRCGQISHDLSKCDFCSRPIAATDRVKQRTYGAKRRIVLDSTSGGGSGGSGSTGSQLQPTEAKISKHTFYGSHTMAATVVGNNTLQLVQPPPTITSSNSMLLTVRQAVTTNGQARPLLSVAATQLASKPMCTVATANRRGRKEPECLTISISSDEEADGEGSLEECPPQRSASCETSTKENHGALRPAAAEVQCLTVQETPPQSPRSGRGGVMVLTLPTSSEALRGSGTGASCSPSAPLASTTMRFSCRSIRVGSYKVASSEHWVTVSSRGFEFSIPPPREGPEVLVHLSNTDVVQVLGHLTRFMPVLFVSTSRECSVEVRAKLGMNRKLPGYFDPAGPEENQKRITFLPEPPFSEDQKVFLRQVFPGPLLQEIKQTQANEILIKSSPSPAMLMQPAGYCSPALQRSSEAAVTSAAPPVTQSGSSAVTHVVIHTVPGSTIMTRTTRSSVAASAGCVTSVVSSSDQGSPQEERSSGPNVKLLVYPPPPKTGGITVHSADLRCLRQGQFLNDVIIDFYLKYLLLERLSEDVRQRTHIFSSFFYPRLTQRLHPRAPGQAGLSLPARRHRNVRTWTRHVDIFDKDFIVVPINQNAHWFLAVLCFPGTVARVCPPKEVAPPAEDHTLLADSQSPAASPKTPEGNLEDGENVLESDPDDGTDLEETGSPQQSKGSAEIQSDTAYILILDSLRGGLCGKGRIIATLREYLTEEWRAKKRTELTFCAANMHGYTPRTPQQGNFSDCGVYLLQYVESFLEKPPSPGEPVRLELGNWFPEGQVAQKRAAIRDLILNLHMQQNPGSDFPQRWRKEEEKEEEAAALRVEEPPVPTTVLVTAPTSVILVCPPGNSGVSGSIQPS
ncbi:uncharacterized protein LOC144099462 isoform X2 [Amblyomma americanum]